MTISERMEQIREHLGETQEGIAQKLGISRESWRRYKAGAVPTGEPLLALWNLGFSINWILAGEGAMLAEEAGGVREEAGEYRPPEIDVEFMGRVVDAVAALYKQENVRLPPVDQGRIAGELYNNLAMIEDEAERRGALRYAIEQKRRELRAPAVETPSSKRLA